MAWDGMRSGAVSGGIQAGIFSTIGDAAHAAQVAGTWKHSAMHAFGGGVSSAVQGGEFWQGAVSQGITHYSGTMTNINNLLGDSVAGQTTMQAIMGGSISSLSGGNFQNAATTAAFAHMFNACSHGECFSANDGLEAPLQIANFRGASSVLPETTNCQAIQVCYDTLRNESQGNIIYRLGKLTPSPQVTLALEYAGAGAIGALCTAMNSKSCNTLRPDYETPWPEW